MNDKPKNKQSTADPIIPTQPPTQHPTTNAPPTRCEVYEERNEKGNCVEIDACAKKSIGEICGPNANCTSVLGKARCDCQDGYLKNSISGYCEDKDECENGESKCEDVSSTCQNLAGSYECICRPGFEKSKKGTECVNINECKTPDLYNCHYCTDTLGSFKCQCFDGYTLQEDGKTCIEENKCESTANSTSFCDGICKKTDDWYYTCKKCPQGVFWLDKEKEKCLPYNEFNCDEGFIKNLTTGLCEMENYCLKEKFPCPYRMRCQNLMGSKECVCRPGYLWDSEKKRCIDIHECINKHGLCNHKCLDDSGPMSCLCYPGYVLEEDKKTCAEEDPCYDKAFCDGIWKKNDQGECVCKRCPNGLIVSYSEKPYDEKDRKKEECFVVNQCKGRETCPAGETCIELQDDDSTAQCVDLSCPEGYEVRNEDGVCIKKEGVNDGRALAISKRLLLLPLSYVKADKTFPAFGKLRTLYRFNKTDCPNDDEISFKIENTSQKYMKKFQVKKNQFHLVRQRASHNLLLVQIDPDWNFGYPFLVGGKIEREQEFVLEMNISCKGKNLHAYKLHVFVV